MLKPKAHNLQTYTDGHGTAWEVSDRKLYRCRQEVIHYADFFVGERRFWDAYVAGVEIAKAILVPEQTAIRPGDVFVDEHDVQYEVKQVDRKDTRPVSLLVSLSASPIRYRSTLS